MFTVKLWVFLSVEALITVFLHGYLCQQDEEVTMAAMNRLTYSSTLRIYNKDFSNYKRFQIDHVTLSNHLEKNKDLIIYTFDVNGAPDSDEAKTVISALLSRPNTQVMLFDWSKKNSLEPLAQISMNRGISFLKELQPVGCELGQALAKLSEMGLDYKRIVLIGHGLGTILMGYAAKCFQKDYGQKIKLIWGLDPVGSLYEQYFDFIPTLDKSCAEKIYILHTDPHGYGSDKAMGTVDFWPEYTTDEYIRQPGCIYKADPLTWLPKFLCNHNRAWEVFSVGVRRGKTFPAAHADNGGAWLMGEGDPKDLAYISLDINPRASGNYYLKLDAKYPYGFNMRGIYPFVKQAPKN